MKEALFKTFVSRFLILLLNFGLVIYSTNMWGSSGKGVISIVIADLTIISFFANIFVGSSMSYFARKFRTEEILPFAYVWAILIGILIPLIFSFSRAAEYFYFLVGLSVTSSLLTANINLFVGQQNIKLFNLYTVLQQVVHILFIIIIIYVIKFTSVKAYFAAQISCFTILFITSAFQITKSADFKKISFTKGTGSKLLNYGWKTQSSAFLQFLNNRLSFYFLEYFKGIVSVGIFSVGIAFSEAVWTVSRSLSVVLYSDVVNSTDSKDAIEKTKISVRISFLVTLFFIFIMLMIPAEWYAMVFGKDFRQTKEIVLLLSPGILAIAVSNVIGYYFAGVNKLRILNVKSLAGLIFTLVSSFYIVPEWGMKGACLINSASYCLSSGVLFWRFYQITEFRIRDFILSKKEMDILIRKMLKNKE
ncbi:lipopolysaccharide biosynthesis protein [Chryseobacterium salviniae]|uniref:Polysaccharide biosynthesis C-terminal domain-containing protein n=1 Tax=Chryseobacterium salviniae TaxID=3101750 RepID=A0ABU6HQ60_9FLAO|nr:polysaccharide biosynthesis C-terminal domain-containing protein [Chryseobacterium sp. T9W2-O]MEC3875184.1 polysaccharide biosynthesis C-terminal domain-containing protein [Chryseobacterium sp. T9W2-O]